MPRWVSPWPQSSVWWVSALRSRRSDGSSSSRRCSALASLSSSLFDLAWMATARTGAGGSNGSTVMSAPRAPRTSPVVVSASFATAAMSPAGTSETGSCSLPRMSVSWCRRSSCMVRPLTNVASAFTVPCSTLNRFTCPTYGSTMVLNTNATGGPSPASAVGAGPSSTMNVARRSTPTSLVALPHSTGNTAPDATPSASACRELTRRDGLVGEVALHQVVVADHDPLDERVVDRVLLHLHLGWDGALGRGAVDVVHCVVVEELDDAVEVGFVADRQLERCHAGAELLLELVEGAGERRALAVELVDEDGARQPEVVGHAPRDLGLHLDALDRGHHEHREVGGPQRGGDVTHEVGVARRVDHVDLVARVLERGDRQRHRDPPPCLLGVEVGGGGAVLHLAEPGDGPGREQEGLGEGGLPRPAVADQGHVADLLRRERLDRHRHPPDSRSRTRSSRRL